MLPNFLRGNRIQNRRLLRLNHSEPQTLGEQWRNFRDDIEIDLRERFGLNSIPGKHPDFWSWKEMRLYMCLIPCVLYNL